VDSGSREENASIEEIGSQRGHEGTDMNIINLIMTVCSLTAPTVCEERSLAFSADFSLRQCVMAAQPYIAQWTGEHPKWHAVKWRCEYPHSGDRASAASAPTAG
jgi:hypothetical protein